jgi:hypothetical protein
MSAALKKPENTNAGGMIVTMTQAELRELVSDAVREAVGAQRAPDAYLDMEQAAAHLHTTVSSLRTLVARGRLVPDHRGQRGGGLKGNRFTRETLDAFFHRKHGDEKSSKK